MGGPEYLSSRLVRRRSGALLPAPGGEQRAGPASRSRAARAGPGARHVADADVTGICRPGRARRGGSLAGDLGTDAHAAAPAAPAALCGGRRAIGWGVPGTTY